MKRIWTDKLDNLLRRHYPSGDLDALAERLGVTRSAVKCRVSTANYTSAYTLTE